jgi:hypothetical protein
VTKVVKKALTAPRTEGAEDKKAQSTQRRTVVKGKRRKEKLTTKRHE